MNWLDGQARTRWRNEQEAKFVNALRYYLGPTGIPDKLNALAQLAQFTDAGDYMEAGEASQALWNDPSVQNAARYATAGAALAVPFVGAKMLNDGVDVVGDALSSGADDLKQFFVDEDGAIRVWHGSPHDFDKFSMDRIGTGEGAQAYGHGLYFAENKETAEQYRKALGHKAQSIDVDGKRIDVSGSVSEMDGRQKAALMLRQVLDDGGEIWQAKLRARNALRQAESGGLTSFQKEAGWGDVQSLKEAVAYLDEWDGKDISAVPDRLYEVEIDANPEDFLDWDAPLSAQPEGVRNVFEQYANDLDADPNSIGPRRGGVHIAKKRLEMDTPVGDAYGSLDRSSGVKPDEISSRMREAGIPGIKYLDQGSRGAGDGTRNYVVFDDSLVNILSKDGAQTPQGRGRQVLDMLGEGRGADVTDDMLDMGDPVLNARLNEYLFNNYDLPMDEASRMARAGEMGFGGDWYRGVSGDHPIRERSMWTDDPTEAGGYAVGGALTNSGAEPNIIAARMADDSILDVQDVVYDALEQGDDIDAAIFNAVENSGAPYGEFSHPPFYSDEEQFVRAVTDPTAIRSRFARFDPRLAHLRNLSAGVGGAAAVGSAWADFEEQTRPQQ